MAVFYFRDRPASRLGLPGWGLGGRPLSVHPGHLRSFGRPGPGLGLSTAQIFAQRRGAALIARVLLGCVRLVGCVQLAGIRAHEGGTLGAKCGKVKAVSAGAKPRLGPVLTGHNPQATAAYLPPCTEPQGAGLTAQIPAQFALAFEKSRWHGPRLSMRRLLRHPMYRPWAAVAQG